MKNCLVVEDSRVMRAVARLGARGCAGEPTGPAAPDASAAGGPTRRSGCRRR